MRCPVEGCGGQMRVINTCDKHSHVRRNRRCDRCGHRLGTSEFAVPGRKRHLDEQVICGVIVGLANNVRPHVLARRWNLPLKRVLELMEDLEAAHQANVNLASQELAQPPTQV